MARTSSGLRQVALRAGDRWTAARRPPSQAVRPDSTARLGDRRGQGVPQWALAVDRARRWADGFEDRWFHRVAFPRWLRNAAAWLVTFNFVCLGWVFFRATSFANAVTVLGRLFSTGQAALDPMVVLVVVAALATQFIPARVTGALVAYFSRWNLAAQVAALGLTIVVIDVWGPAGVAPFIYFRF